MLREITAVKNLDLKRPRHALAMAGTLAALAVLTILHLPNFKNAQAYWSRAVETSPHSAFAHKQLGTVLEKSGDIENAEIEYLAALELKPNELLVNYNLGVINVKKSKLIEAKKYFRTEIAFNDLFDDAHINLAVVYYYLEDFYKGTDELEYVISYNPDNLVARQNLVLFYIKMRNLSAAREQITEVIARGGTPNPHLQKLLT